MLIPEFVSSTVAKNATKSIYLDQKFAFWELYFLAWISTLLIIIK